MRVSLGTIEVEDDVRKEVRKLIGGKGHATRAELKDYYLELIENHGKLLVADGVSEPNPLQGYPIGGQTVDTLSEGDATPPTGTASTDAV